LLRKKILKKIIKKHILPIVLMLCDDHPRYKSNFPPKTKCPICWKIYATKLRLSIKTLKQELIELNGK